MNMKEILITGNIGAGKSQILNILRTKGYSVFSFDEAAKEILQCDSDVIRKVKHFFYTDVYDRNYQLNRNLLSQLLLESKDSRTHLYAILKGPLLNAYYNFVMDHYNEFYVFAETASLDIDIYKLFDFVEVVWAPVDLRENRCTENRKMDIEAFHAWNDTQLGSNELNGRLQKHNIDFNIFENTSDIKKIELEVEKLIKTLKDE